MRATAWPGLLEGEGETDADDGEGLREGEAEDGDALQHAARLGLAGDAADVRSEDQTDADARTDGGEAVPDHVQAAVDRSIHCEVPFQGSGRAGDPWDRRASARQPVRRRCR